MEMSQVEGLDAPAIMRIGAARLTAGLDRMPRLDLDAHREIFGPLPRLSIEELISMAEQVDLPGPGQAEARRASANLDHLAGHGDRLQRRDLQRSRDCGGGRHDKQHQPGEPTSYQPGPPGRVQHAANTSHPSSTLTTVATARNRPAATQASLHYT